MSISYAQYERMNKQRGPEAGRSNDGPLVRFFYLKNDGDEALVRFMVDAKEDLELVKTHQIIVRGYPRKVECLREEGNEPLENCPFCEAGEPIQSKIYIKLLEYVRGEDGSVQPVAKVWERPVSYGGTISNYLTEYGPLSNMLFKIKRKGAAGSTNTTYDIIFASPNTYPMQNYPNAPELFDGYSVVGNTVLKKDFQGMLDYLAEPEASAPTNNYKRGPAATQPAARTYNSNYGTTAAAPSVAPSAAPSASELKPATVSVGVSTPPAARVSTEAPATPRPRRFY